MIRNVLRREGGYVNNPNDKGGPTNMGITQDTLSAWMMSPASIQDVKDLDNETAYEIFENKYYIHPRINQLPKELQPVVFDTAINSGPRRAIRLIQKASNDLGGGQLKVDGVLGPKTRRYINAAYEFGKDIFINMVVDQRIRYLYKIIKSNPSQNEFIDGWTKRAEEFRKKPLL